MAANYGETGHRVPQLVDPDAHSKAGGAIWATPYGAALRITGAAAALWEDYNGRALRQKIWLGDLSAADAFDVIESMIVDDRMSGRFEAIKDLREVLYRPLDPDEAKEYDAELFGDKNVEAAIAQGMGDAADPFVAQPVVHPRRPAP